MDIDELYVDRNTGIFVPQTLLMFVQVPVKFIRNPKYDIGTKMAYIYLWSFGISTKYAYPSVKTIAEDLKISENTARNNVKKLEKAGGVFILNRIKEDTKEKLPNLYYLADIDTDGSFNLNTFDVLKQVYPKKIKYQ